VTVLLTAQLLAHLGALHAYEQALVLLIAFGPFVVLGVVVVVMRRRDIAAEEREAQDEPSSQDAPT
jgi:hypothetical protein